MPLDKFSAVWVSHSSIADFLKCPRLYYLRNIYKDPRTGHKITRMQPPLALGQAVHEVIDTISTMRAEERASAPLLDIYNKAWEKIAGKKGGFTGIEEEAEAKNRGKEMLMRIKNNPGPLLKKAIKIKTESGLPYYWLSEEDNLILNGKIDWLEYLEETDSVHVIDFKTGKYEEKEDSLQLPIYLLLLNNTQQRPVTKASYWYLDRDDEPTEIPLPDKTESFEKIYSIAKRIKLARQLEHFKCATNGCIHCSTLESIAKGEGELVGISEYKQDIYII